MAGTIKQISQRLAALDQEIEALGQTFHDTYRGYLTQLGQAVRHQLIQSCYHICTENHPKRFLNLPVSRRQKLQEDFQKLSRQVETQLLEILRPISDVLAEPETPEEPDELEALFSKIDAPKSEAPSALNPLEALAEWQDQLERAIVTTLKSTASSANRLLQDAEILPKRLPQPIPESPSKSDADEENSDAADLLSLLAEGSERVVELQKAPQQLAAVLMQTSGVNLRLSEIEFNTPAVMSWRNKLRDLKKQFQTLGQEYQKKLREQAIVEAQLAWKSTWIKDE